VVENIYIYYEGDGKLKEGFRKFLEGFYHKGPKIQLIAGKGNAIADFMTGLKSNKNAVSVLLIDSEGPNGPNALAQVKRHDHWESNIGSTVANDQVHFMVQVIEAWFLADRQALQGYYGHNFRDGRLRRDSNVEQIPKDDVINGLREATRETQKGAYHKTLHAPDLLARIDPSKVCAAAPSCSRLFDSLEMLTTQSI
jgi:hypothetical protein